MKRFSLLRWLFSPPKWRVEVLYNVGPSAVWECERTLESIDRHIPRLGETHGDRYVIGVSWQPI